MNPHQLLKDLYNFDCQAGEGRLCPRLTKAHLDPTSFQKMNVALTMQVTMQIYKWNFISVTLW